MSRKIRQAIAAISFSNYASIEISIVAERSDRICLGKRAAQARRWPVFSRLDKPRGTRGSRGEESVEGWFIMGFFHVNPHDPRVPRGLSKRERIGIVILF